MSRSRRTFTKIATFEIPGRGEGSIVDPGHALTPWRQLINGVNAASEAVR